MTTLCQLYLWLALAGVTRPAPPARTPLPKALTACAAVTRADVESVMGFPVAAGREESGGAESSCDYAVGRGMVAIGLQRVAADVDVAQEMAALREAIPGSVARPAAGIGRRAFFLDIAGAGTQLHVLGGERDWLLVSVLGLGEGAAVSAMAERLARRALARM